jgi:hypothetical protein
MRFAIGLFLIAHGLVHLMYLAPRPEGDASYPFVPEDRWLARILGISPWSAKTIAIVASILTALVLAVAGIALVLDATVWEPAAVVGAGLSLALMLAFYHPWLSIGIAIDLAIVASVTWLHVPASLFDA